MTLPAAWILTAERLREVLHYDHDTGIFTWRKRPSLQARVVKPGDVAGRLDTRGHRQIKIDRRLYAAHRLAWLYVHGRWPTGDLDHANGERDDNRIINLREATRTQNNANSRRRSANTSGIKGVRWHKQNKRWTAALRLNGRAIHLGYFDTKEAAALAYERAAREHFGEFVRLV